MKINIFLFVLFILNFAIVSGQKNTNDTLYSKSIVDIEIATFKYLFKNNASGLKQKATIYYLNIEGNYNKTLSDVIKELDSNKPKVKDINEFDTLSEEEKKKVKYLHFNIYSMKLENGIVHVNCGYYEGNLSSSENVISLVKKRKKWKVVSNEILWISNFYRYKIELMQS